MSRFIIHLMVFDGSQGFSTVIVVKSFLIGYFGAFLKTKSL